MIVQRFLLFLMVFYREILLAQVQEFYIADAIAHAPHHLLVRLEKVLDFTPLEAVCAGYRHQSGPGCPPTYPICLLVRAILVGWLYGLSFRQLEERLHTDLVVRWFVGALPGMPLPDHSTLERFELWLMERHLDLYFSSFLAQIDRLFPEERQAVQMGDTYAMLACAADEGLIRRFRHVCLRLMMELADSLPGQFEPYLQGFDWPALFGSKGEPIEALMGKEALDQRLERTVLAALDLRLRVGRLLDGYASGKYVALRTWCAHLDKLLSDEVKIERNDQQEPVKVTELAQKDKGEYRLISATDPEATLRKHGEKEEDLSFGYNIQVACTTTAGFIRETKAYTGADPDQSGVAALIDEQKKRQKAAGQPTQLPPKLIYDKAAGYGKIRKEVLQASNGQTQVVARQALPGPQEDAFGPYNFLLSVDGQSLTCPNGKVSHLAYAYPRADGRHFQFLACQCWNGEPPQCKAGADLSQRCPLFEQCRSPRLGIGSTRQVFISDYREQVLAANAYNQTDSFKQEMKLRSRIERVIFELTHYHGARRCRRRGLLAADFQAKMCALVYNLKLLVRRVEKADA